MTGIVCLPVQDMLQDATTAGGVHPMMRLIADAAPQKGEIAMRSGQVPEVRPACFLLLQSCLKSLHHPTSPVSILLYDQTRKVFCFL